MYVESKKILILSVKLMSLVFLTSKCQKMQKIYENPWK